MPMDATPSSRRRDRRWGFPAVAVAAAGAAAAFTLILASADEAVVVGSLPDPTKTEAVSSDADADGFGDDTLSLDWVDDWFEDYGEGDVLDANETAAAELDISGERAVLV